MPERTVIRGFDVPELILNRWRELCCQAFRPSPNIEPDRFLSTTRALGATPAIIAVEDDNGQHSMIVGRQASMRVNRRIGYFPVTTPRLKTLAVVYGGMLGNADPEFVADCLFELLNNETGIEHIMLNYVSINLPIYAELQRRNRITIQPPTEHWVQKLDESLNLSMAHHSGKHRRRLRWELKKLEEAFDGSLTWLTRTSESDVESVLADAAHIGGRTYHAKVGGLVQLNEIWRSLLQPFADSGQLRAHFLVGSAEPIAFVLGCNFGDTLHVLAMGFLPEYSKFSPGKHLLLQAIDRACQDGMKWVDYGFGNAEYKRVYGTECWLESPLHIYGATPRAEAARIIDCWSTRVNSVLKRVIGSSAATRIKRSWRSWLSTRSM